MKRSDWIAICGMVLSGLVTTISSAAYLSFKIGGLAEQVKEIPRIKDDIKEIRGDINEIRGDINEIRVDVKEAQVKLDILWKRELAHAYSPMKPDKAVMEALKKSKVAQFADQHYDEILSQVKSLEPENTNQAQEALISVVGRFKTTGGYKRELYEAAHESNHDVDSLLIAMALSISERVVCDLGFEKGK